MARTTIAIELDVYDALLNMKHGNDTFTDVLRRVLGLKRGGKAVA